MAKICSNTEYLNRNALETLIEGLYAIAIEALGPDDDGHSKVQILVIDKTRYESMHYVPIPHDDRIDGANEQAMLIRSLVQNLSLANSALETFYRCLDFNPPIDTTGELRGLHSVSDQSLVEENQKLVDLNDKIDKELREHRREGGIQIRKDEAVKRARAQRDRAHDALSQLESAMDSKVPMATIRKMIKDGLTLSPSKKDK